MRCWISLANEGISIRTQFAVSISFPHWVCHLRTASSATHLHHRRTIWERSARNEGLGIRSIKRLHNRVLKVQKTKDADFKHKKTTEQIASTTCARIKTGRIKARLYLINTLCLANRPSQSSNT
jgi:hypothetical protein